MDNRERNQKLRGHELIQSLRDAQSPDKLRASHLQEVVEDMMDGILNPKEFWKAVADGVVADRDPQCMKLWASYRFGTPIHRIAAKIDDSQAAQSFEVRIINPGSSGIEDAEIIEENGDSESTN